MSSRSPLASTIEGVCEAPDAFDIDIPHALSTILDKPVLESSLETLHTELPKLAAERDILREASVIQNQAKHSARGSALINCLPVEILTSVFSILVSCDDICCTHGQNPGRGSTGLTFAHIISRVNRLWRRITTSTGSFWSHIDIELADEPWPGPGAYVNLKLERARNSPLELHILCSGTSNSTRTQAAALYHYFRSRETISLSLMAFIPDNIELVLRFWLNNSEASPLRELKLIRTSSYVVDTPLIPQLLDPPTQIHANLLQLQVLNLSGVYIIPWDQVRLGGLVDLALENLLQNACPTVEQLSRMLADSPNLVSLRLSDILVRPGGSEPGSRIAPARLRRLEYLALGRLDATFTRFLLALIRPGLGALCFNYSCHLPDSELGMNDLKSFCNRYQIATLSLSVPSYNAQRLALFLSSLEHLRTLNISNISYHQSIFDSTFPDAQRLHCPNLRGSRLFRCEITYRALQSLIEAHQLRWLKLDRCLISKKTDQNELGGWEFSSEYPESLVEWLKERIPELELITHSNLPYAYSRTLNWWLPSI